MAFQFTKMEGCGNDYVLVDGVRVPFPLEQAPGLAIRWSDRHFGIGADGLIVMVRGTDAPVRMLMWNADGSRGAMCGNGLRCLGALAIAHGHASPPRLLVETDSGPREVEILDRGLVRAAIGAVRIGPPRRVDATGRALEIWPGDAGNPHAVIFVDDVDDCPVELIGAWLQRHPCFSGGVNVDFVQVLGEGRMRQRTFERGSGETLACGTGAAVAAAVARACGRVAGDRVAVELRGGELTVVGSDSYLAIEGAVSTVFSGEIDSGP